MVSLNTIHNVFLAFRIFGVALFAISFVVTLMGVVDKATVVTTYLKDASCDLPPSACNLLEAFGFPPQLLSYQYFIWYSAIPLIAIFFVTYHFLKGAFESTIAIGIAAIVAAASVPMGVVLAFDAILLMFLGQYAFSGGLLIAFLAVGEGIVAALFAPEMRGERDALSRLEKEEKKAQKRINDLRDQVIKENIRRGTNRYREIEQEIAANRAKLVEINEKRMMLAEMGASERHK